MVKQKGSSASKRRKSKPLTYFYLNGNLHKKLHINLGADEITAWCYPLGKRVTYTYSDVKRRKEPAFTNVEVAKILQRHPETIKSLLIDGNVEKPQFTYGLNEHRRIYKYMWHEKDIMAAHAYLSSLHRGRPRNDGLITPVALPTARQVRALVRNQEILYVKIGDEFVPTWEAPDI